MIRVLLADKLPPETMAALADLGLEVVSEPGLGADDLPGAVPGAHVLVVRSTVVTADTIEAGDRLQLVIRAGAGTNTIDCAAAARKAIHVANCAGKNAVAVAELTWGLILSLDRFIPDNVASLREGRWEKGRYGKGRGLLGRTLGIVGFGRIGQEVAHRGKAFGMHCITADPFLTPERAQELGVGYAPSVLDLCARSDVITVHVPMSPDTHHLIDDEAFSAMGEGTLFIHMARGGIVDDQALRRAVDSGHIRAACDVYESEPKGSSAAYDGPFRDVDGFYGTHHIGASTEQAQLATGEEVVRIVGHWLRTGDVPNCVNRTEQTSTAGQLLIRHLDQVGVLARILGVIRGADISVKEMQNTIFDGTGAAVAAITLDRPPTDEVVTEIRETGDEVLGVEWVEPV